MSIIDAFDSSEEKKNKSHLRNIIRLAMADGQIDDAELDRIRKAARFLGVTPAETDELIANPDKIHFIPPATKQERLERLVRLMRVVLADGIISSAEDALLRRICIGLGFDQAKIRTLIDAGYDALKQGKDTDEVIEVLEPMC